MNDFSSIPLIDVGGLRQADQDAILSIAAEIRDAAANVGFLYITNHGIDQTVFDAAIESSRDFFHLPDAEKQKIATDANNRGYNAVGKAHMDGAKYPDDKEYYQIGLDLPETDPDVMAGQPLRGPNIWPEGCEAFRFAMTAYFDAVGQVGRDMLRAVAIGFGVSEDFFVDKYTKPLQRTQVVYYPARPPETDPEHFGVAPHSDYGCMTLLYQDSVGGLHVRNKSGDWVAAPPVPGSLVVNIGDLLERWSNNRFVSTKHMVRNRSGQERLSIATFFDPDFTANVDPRDLGLAHDEESLFEPVLAGDHILGRIRRSITMG